VAYLQVRVEDGGQGAAITLTPNQAFGGAQALFPIYIEVLAFQI
jgi:hypothetical protein